MHVGVFVFYGFGFLASGLLILCIKCILSDQSTAETKVPSYRIRSLNNDYEEFLTRGRTKEEKTV